MLHRRRELLFFTILLLAGLLLRLAYLSYTDYETRSNDVYGHIDYIVYVASNMSFPTKDQCWECFQPPLYYLISGFYYKALMFLDVADRYFWLQLLSLAFFMGFLIFAVKIFDYIFAEPRLKKLASIFLVFWPAGIIHSVRIGNDVLLYFLYTAGLFFLLRWHKEDKKVDLLLSVLLGSFAVCTKQNGFILLLLILIVFLLKLYRSKGRGNFFKQNGYALIIIAAAFLPLLTTYLVAGSKKANDHDWWLVANSQYLPEWLAVENKPIDYLKLDLHSYLKYPYIYSWSDATGRQFFWNYLLKSSLYGEFQLFYGFPYDQLVKAMNIVLVIIIIFVFIWVISNLGQIIRTNVILLLNGLLLLLSVLYLRIKTPVACSSDFRYILPILVTTSAFYAMAVNDLAVKGRLMAAKAGYFIGIVFSAMSVAFFVLPVIKQYLL